MNSRQKLIYGAVMALVVFFTGQIVLQVGSLVINIVFALLMGAFAILAVTVAARIAGRNNDEP
jgi:uncharacterized membrane protein